MNKQKFILYIVATSFITVLVVLVFAGGFLYLNREAVVNRLFNDDVPIQTGSEVFPSVTKESRITEIVEKSSPAVVSVVASLDIPEVRRIGPFEIVIPGGGEERRVSSGTGFFISSDGLVMTNRHVVFDEEANYSIFFSDGRELEAEVLDRDPFNDLAVLKVDAKGEEFLEFGDSMNLKPGQTVIAIGNALGEFTNSVSVGVISGLSRSIVAGDTLGASEFIEEVIQTDAAINPGNSGGPLLDINGQVIGVNVALATGSENIAFALPGNLAKQVASSVEENGEIVWPYLGVRYVEINNTFARANNLAFSYGAYVLSSGSGDEPAVVPGSPADEAGIREGDIILSIDGVSLRDGKTLGSEIRKKRVGGEVILEVYREGNKINIKAVLREAPEEI